MECLDKDRTKLHKETRHIFSNQVRVLSFPENTFSRQSSQAIQAILLRQNMSFHSVSVRLWWSRVYNLQLTQRVDFIFVATRPPVLICSPAFITWLHRIFFFSTLWNGFFYKVLNIHRTPFLSFFLQPSLAVFIILSLHICRFLTLFVVYKEIMAEEGHIKSGDVLNCVCALYGTCRRSSEGKASSRHVPSVPERGCRWRPQDWEDGCKRGQREIKAGFSFKYQMCLWAQYLFNKPWLNNKRPKNPNKVKIQIVTESEIQLRCLIHTFL